MNAGKLQKQQKCYASKNPLFLFLAAKQLQSLKNVDFVVTVSSL